MNVSFHALTFWIEPLCCEIYLVKMTLQFLLREMVLNSMFGVWCLIQTREGSSLMIRNKMGLIFIAMETSKHLCLNY